MKKLLLLSCVTLSLFAASLPISRRAPGFSLPDVDLKQHDLQDYRGKVVLMDFMRTDCPKCVELTPMLEQLKAKFGSEVVVLSVVTAPDNQATMKRYIAEKKVTGPMLYDCGQMTASYLQVTPKNPTVHFPRLMIVDKEGIIRRDLDIDADSSLFNVEALAGLVEPIVKKK